MTEKSFNARIFPIASARAFLSLAFAAFLSLVPSVLFFSSREYLNDTGFLLLCCAGAFFPFAVFSPLAGYVADRMSKRYVIILSAFFETLILLFGCYVLAGRYLDVYYGIPIVLALESFITPFFNVASSGILPETFSEKDLSRACGRLASAKSSGIISGFVLSVILYCACGRSSIIPSVLVVSSAFAAFLSALYVAPSLSPFQRGRDRALVRSSSFGAGWKGIFHDNSLLFCMGGDVLFSCVAAAIQPIVFIYGHFALGLDDVPSIALLQISPFLGMVIGSWFGGRASGDKVELGLTPVGALGMLAALCVLAFMRGEALLFSFVIPRAAGGVFFKLDLSIHFYALFSLMFAGFSAGLFIIPLRAFFLHKTSGPLKGAFLSVRETFRCIFSSLCLFFTSLLAVGSCRDVPFAGQISAVMPEISYRTLLIVPGAAVLLLTLFSMWFLPGFLLRFIILACSHTIFRIRIKGAENIPSNGPAIILSNHVSYADTVFISACTSRQIRFLMTEEFYSRPVIGFIARLTGFFRVPARGRSKDMRAMFEDIRSFLSSGGIVGTFPEGKITRNGIPGRFRHGFEMMVPKGASIPLIPVSISFSWGGIFSLFPRRRTAVDEPFPYFVSVTFGKPFTERVTPFEVRQKICELAAESAMSPMPGEVPLHTAFAVKTKKHPFRIVAQDHGSEGVSSLSFFLRSLLLSREIRMHVQGDEKFVGILLPNCSAAGMTILASLLADETPCVLNYSVSQEIFNSSLRSGGIKLVITSRKFLARIRVKPPEENTVYIEDIAASIPKWKGVLYALAFFLIPVREFMNMVSPVTARDLDASAALLFSSGSTGVPKGIVLSHHNINSNVYSVSRCIALNLDDASLANLPLFHSFGLTVCFWMPIINLVRVVFIPNPLDAVAVCDSLAGDGITLLFATPSFMQRYMQKSRKGDFDTLRFAVTGAEHLRSDIADKFKSITDGKLQIMEGYGCTELSPVVCVNLPTDVRNMGRKVGAAGSIGLALENISARILDPISFKSLPPGAEGLLCVKAPSVMKGYLNNPALTEASMHGEYYDTGDIARMDEHGYVTICGRLSRFSKIAGEMVPHELVESVINEICSLESRSIAVCGMPDKVKGEVLLVLYTDEVPLTPQEIVDRLRERSISNLWIPKVKNFRKVASLPVLGSGKLDFTAIRAMADEIAKEAE